MTINEQLGNNNIDIIFTDIMNMNIIDIVQGQYSSQKSVSANENFRVNIDTFKDDVQTISLHITEEVDNSISSNFTSADKSVTVNITKDGEITIVINGNEVFNVTDAGAINVTNEVYDVDKQQTLDNAVMILEADGLTNLANLIRNN